MTHIDKDAVLDLKPHVSHVTAPMWFLAANGHRGGFSPIACPVCGNTDTGFNLDDEVLIFRNGHSAALPLKTDTMALLPRDAGHTNVVIPFRCANGHEFQLDFCQWHEVGMRKHVSMDVMVSEECYPEIDPEAKARWD